MTSLTLDMDQESTATVALESPGDQIKDEVQAIMPCSSAHEVALPPTIGKDAKAENGNPSFKESQLTSTQRKNIKKQNVAKHHPKTLKSCGNAGVTATKKVTDDSKKSHHNSPDPAASAKSSLKPEDGLKEFTEFQERSVTLDEQKFPEEVLDAKEEVLDIRCTAVQLEAPPQSFNDPISQQADACEDAERDKISADRSLKDSDFSDSVAVTQPSYSPVKSFTEEKIRQSSDGGLPRPLIVTLDEIPKPSRLVDEKLTEKKIIHRGLKKGFEKPSKISTDFHSPAKTQASSSISQKNIPAVQREKSPKTPHHTPPKSISPMKAAKISPESAESEGSAEKEDMKTIKKNSYEKPLKKSLAPFLKTRKSPLGQRNISNEQQTETNEDGPNNIENFKQQDAQQSGSGKGQLLLKIAKLSYASGDNPNKALDHATRAVKFFESNASDSSSLELVSSLHILAAVHFSLGQYEEAISVLQCSLALINSNSRSSEGTMDNVSATEQMLALFSGQMQLGDTFVLSGMQEKALESYHIALEIQKQALGDMDPLVGETCRYLAEAHLQAMQFKEAEEMCKHVLKIHSENNSLGPVEESTDRRLLALILSAKGEHEAALEHLVFASTTLSSAAKDVEVAAVDCCIGDAYVSLGRYDEAVFAYQKALTIFKSVKGEAHSSVASIYVSLAEVSLKTGKQREAKSHADNALRIYGKHGARHALDELAIGLTAVAAVYEAVNEREQALCLLQRALEILEKAPGEHNAAAGVEAQMGIIYLGLGKPSNSFAAFKNAVLKLRAGSEENTALIGILLNQMGLACVELRELAYAAEVFQEAQSILEEVCGPHHPDTLAVCSNLAGVYDALGRIDDAISLLESNIQVKEQRLGTVHRDVEDERQRLMELLREAGRPHIRKSNTLEQLFTLPSAGSSRYERAQR